MIANSTVSAGFTALARYLEQPKAGRHNHVRVAWTTPRMLIDDSCPKAAAREMRIVANGSSSVRKPVLHVSISWAPEDNPSRDQMEEVADTVLNSINMKHHQALYVAHGDEDYDHLHVMANRVHPITRRAANMYHYWYDIAKVLRHAERRMGFREVPGHLYQLPDQRRPERSQSFSKGAYKTAMRGQGMPFQMLVNRAAGQDFKQANSWDDLTARLRRHGLRMEPQRTGIVVTDGQEYAKSSSVVPGLSGRALAKRFNESYDAYLARRQAPVKELARAVRKTGLDHTENTSYSDVQDSPTVVQAFQRLQENGRSAEVKAALGEDAYITLSRLAARSVREQVR